MENRQICILQLNTIVFCSESFVVSVECSARSAGFHNSRSERANQPEASDWLQRYIRCRSSKCFWKHGQRHLCHKYINRHHNRRSSISTVEIAQSTTIQRECGYSTDILVLSLQQGTNQLRVQIIMITSVKSRDRPQRTVFQPKSSDVEATGVLGILQLRPSFRRTSVGSIPLSLYAPTLFVLSVCMSVRMISCPRGESSKCV